MMIPVFLITFCVFVTPSFAIFKFTDCGGPNSVVSMSNFVLPDPIPNGNRYNYTGQLTVSQEIPYNAVIKTSASRCLIGDKVCIPVPTCADDFGGCTLNVCDRPGFPNYNPLFQYCVGFGRNAIVKPGQYNMNNSVYFPGLDSIESFLINGQWRQEVKLTDPSNNALLGCWNLEYEVSTPKGATFCRGSK